MIVAVPPVWLPVLCPSLPHPSPAPSPWSPMSLVPSTLRKPAPGIGTCRLPWVPPEATRWGRARHAQRLGNAAQTAQGFWQAKGESWTAELCKGGTAMDDLEARKVLKVFGMQVTEFMGRRRELTERAAAAIQGDDRHTLTALLATLMTETSELHRRWLE